VMNNERKQRILIKVAGLPRFLANIAKKVAPRGAARTAFVRSTPKTPQEQYITKNTVLDHILGKEMTRPPAWKIEQLAEAEARRTGTSGRILRPTWPTGSRIPGTHGGKTRWATIRPPIRQQYPVEFPSFQPQWSPIGSFGKFDTAAKAISGRAKARRAVAKYRRSFRNFQPSTPTPLKSSNWSLLKGQKPLSKLDINARLDEILK